MAYASASLPRRNGHLLPAAVALLLAGMAAPLHIVLGGASWPLIWLPFSIVALWPRQVAALPSAILLLLGGLWVDWTTLGATGQWASVFLITYAVVRPDLAESVRGMVSGLARTGQALLIGLPVLVLTGRVVYGLWPDVMALSRGLLVLLLLLPLIIVIRDLFAGRLSRNDF